MTSYSFGDASATLMDGASAATTANGHYEPSRAYRRDSGVAGTCDYHQHSSASPGEATATAAAMGGINTHATGSDSFADYLFKQQQQPGQVPTSTSDISSVVAAVAAAHTTAGNSGIPMFHHDSPLLHSSSTPSGYAPRSSFGGYSAHPRYQEAVAAAISSNNKSPSAATAALPNSASGGLIPATPNSVGMDGLGSTPSSTSSISTASCLADPLPSFLSSLPLPTPMESKYSSIVAGIASANNGSAVLAGEVAGSNSASSSLLAAAAAAAAAAVVSSASATPTVSFASSGNTASGTVTSHANTSYSHYSAPQHSHSSGYAHHSHHHSAHTGAYDVSTLGLSHSSAMSASTPSLSAQVVAAAALAHGSSSAAGATAASSALDLNSYSISAFSRPLSQASPTAAAMMTSDTAGSSFGGIGQNLTQQQTSGQYPQPPYQQQRSYSDYSAYYRSPSVTMGLGTGSTTATGASPMSGTGMNTAAAVAAATAASTGTPATSSNTHLAAAAAAAAAMGSSYYASAAYQPYMRTGGGAYYYAQPQSRYLPYSAYPPIRHFVSPARPFKCETCDQSFSRNHDLKRHVKIHSGVKPHKCPKCGKSFGRSDALKRHSMVKRCRSSTTSGNAQKSTPPAAQSSSVSAQSVSLAQRQLGPQRFDSPASRLSLHPQIHHTQQAHLMQQGLGSSSSGAVMSSVPSSSRLAPAAGSMFGQGGGGGNPSAMAMSASASSIVSSMLSSRTNTI